MKSCRLGVACIHGLWCRIGRHSRLSSSQDHRACHHILCALKVSAALQRQCRPFPSKTSTALKAGHQQPATQRIPQCNVFLSCIANPWACHAYNAATYNTLQAGVGAPNPAKCAAIRKTALVRTKKEQAARPKPKPKKPRPSSSCPKVGLSNYLVTPVNKRCCILHGKKVPNIPQSIDYCYREDAWVNCEPDKTHSCSGKSIRDGVEDGASKLGRVRKTQLEALMFRGGGIKNGTRTADTVHDEQ